MKKIILSFCVLFVSIITVFAYKLTKQESEVSVERLAITLNGKVVNYFPEKGLYSVNVECKNAVGKWLYDEWVLSVENISEASYCTVDFASIEKSNLNEYIMSLVNENKQGNGKVILENNNVTSDIGSYEIAEMRYTLISGVAMKKSNNKYIGNDTVYNSTSKSKFNTNKNGYLEICYEIPPDATSTTNGLTFHKINNSSMTNSSFNSNDESTLNGCFNYGYIKSSDDIYISTRFADNNISLTFKISDYAVSESESYRYEGEDPNNYIWFNNELWRIVGVFDSASHGLNETKLTKIVRANSIGNFSLSRSFFEETNWHNSILKPTLNTYYINSQDGSNSGYCYNNGDISVNCDFSAKGIKSQFRNMIKEVNWFLGNLDYGNFNTSDFFNKERQKLYNSDLLDSKDSGKIALLYPSDFGYGVLEENCSRSINLADYGTEKCSGKNWIFRTLNINSSFLNQMNNLYFNIGYYGIGWDSSSYSKSIFPTLYLNENVYRIGGDGSILNPYIISMD